MIAEVWHITLPASPRLDSAGKRGGGATKGDDLPKPAVEFESTPTCGDAYQVHGRSRQTRTESISAVFLLLIPFQFER